MTYACGAQTLGYVLGYPSYPRFGTGRGPGGFAWAISNTSLAGSTASTRDMRHSTQPLLSSILHLHAYLFKHLIKVNFELCMGACVLRHIKCLGTHGRKLTVQQKQAAKRAAHCMHLGPGPLGAFSS